MHTCRLSHGRWSLALPLLCAPLALLAGCQSDEITTYQAPRNEATASVRVRQRLIAVIFPQGDNIWVVKVLAPEKQIEPLVGDFNKLVESVQLTKDEGKPIVWELPQGWKQLPGNQVRYATLKSPGDEAVEVSITKVPNSPFLENVIRWRKQIGLGPITDEQAKLFTTHPRINGIEAERVDMLGALMTPADPKAPAAPLFQGKANKPLKYKTPDEWQEIPAAQFSVASFVVQQAKVSVSPLPGRAGSVLENVNRWRQQIQLKPIDEEQLKKDLSSDKVGGTEAQYVKLVGDTDAILGFIVKRGDQTWFFKMVGPKDLVEKQEAVFKEFCRSVEF